MESFSNFPLGKNEFREFEVYPTSDYDNQPERLNPTENLASPLPPTPEEVWVQKKTFGSLLWAAAALLLRLCWFRLALTSMDGDTHELLILIWGVCRLEPAATKRGK